MFEHKNKYPTLKNISLKYLTKHYQHQTSSDRVISQSINNTNKDNISSRWAAGLVWRWSRRSMRVVGCDPDCPCTEKRLHVLYQIYIYIYIYIMKN
jgi:hypothetical protein